MRAKRKDVILTYLGFDRLVSASDVEVIQAMYQTVRSVKQRLFPRGLRPNKFQVTRNPRLITVRMFQDSKHGEVEVGSFSFAAPPNFGLRAVRT